MGDFVLCLPAQLTAQEGVKLEQFLTYDMYDNEVGWVARFDVQEDGDTLCVSHVNEEEEESAPEYGEWTWDGVSKAYKKGGDTLKFFSDGSYVYNETQQGGYQIPE